MKIPRRIAHWPLKAQRRYMRLSSRRRWYWTEILIIINGERFTGVKDLTWNETPPWKHVCAVAFATPTST